MRLTPREIDKLMLHQAGFLAQKRYARGLRLNYPESVALIAAVLLELIREGRGVAELMDVGKQILGHDDVMDGVPEMIHEVQVEGTFPDGSKLVTVHLPVCRQKGNPDLALYGSGFNAPAKKKTIPNQSSPHPGEYQVREGQIELNAGREAIALEVMNMGDRPVQVGSHYPFFETNPMLKFDREKAFGRRLNIPAGTAVRFEPGDTKKVELIAIEGEKIILGGNGLTDGAVNETNREQAMKRMNEAGFLNEKS